MNGTREITGSAMGRHAKNIVSPKGPAGGGRRLSDGQVQGV